MKDQGVVDEVFEEFNEAVNMDMGELEAWEESDNREVYGERKSGGQSLDEPLDDIMRLKSTPKSEWEDKDDGFNEVEQAEEAVNFINRMSAGEQGEPMADTDPGLSKRDASLLNWGHDPNPDEMDFEGDRQR